MKIVNESVRNKLPRSKHKQVDKSKKPKPAGNGSRKVKKHTRDHFVAPFPLLQLPRVELWCRNPQCTYNNKIQPHEVINPPVPPQNFGDRMVHPSQRTSHQSKLSSITSISTPLASDSNTTDTTLTIKSSSSGSISQNEQLTQSTKMKYPGVHEFYPGSGRGRIPPPPKQVTALNGVLPRTSTVKPGHRGTSIPVASSAGSCVGCRNLPQHSLEEDIPIEDGKLDYPYSTFWHLNNNFNNNLNLQSSTLKRDASVHSYG
ncbi:unnamed protein product [Allacma fusca]|uniref:Uncharacterized protein n=1 Tax=Allacma fusca TaxID=39272 RepID=A0A8J2K341_9HEXA|nr:unnamed protein product [Allacma fusca]